MSPPGLTYRAWLILGVLALAIAAVNPSAEAQLAKGDVAESAPDFVRGAIDEADDRLLHSYVGVTGRVVSNEGPLADAMVEIGGSSFFTDTRGIFELPGVSRQTHLATVSAAGHLPRVVPIVAGVEAGISAVDVGVVTLLGDKPGRFSMAFGGDVSLGRRYIDPSGRAESDQVPVSDPTALIRVDKAYTDTSAVLEDYATIVAPYDLVSINLETVVTDNPIDPQPGQYLFFTLPESLRAVADVGVDYTSLGNNHVWDYGTEGVLDTHRHLRAAGMTHSGSGVNEEEAFEPAILTVDDAEQTVAMHSWVATRNPPDPYPAHATDTKAGGANASDFNRMNEAVAATEAAGHLSVAHLHIGYEYTERPEPGDPERLVQQRLGAAVDAGADLVVAHHPHVAQGFEFDRGVLVAHSLGNLIFDQERLDTLHGAMLAVTFDGEVLADARVEPILISDYKPTLASGAAADHLLRRLSFVGAEEVVLVPDAGAGSIERRSELRRTERTVRVPLSSSDIGAAMVDLRALRQPGESIGFVNGIDAEHLSLGRDLMMTMGDLEDHDTDALPSEVAPWNYGSAGFVCGSEARRGVGALCSIRTPGNEGPSSIYFGARIRVEGDRINEPNRDVTLLLYERGDNRGDLSVRVSYVASQGDEKFGSVEAARLPARTGPYVGHWIDLDLPDEDPAHIADLPANRPFKMTPQYRNARAFRIRFEHHPPAAGTGLAAVDDVAVISWSSAMPGPDGAFRTPSPYDFLRVDDTGGADTLEVVFHSYEQR